MEKDEKQHTSMKLVSRVKCQDAITQVYSSPLDSVVEVVYFASTACCLLSNVCFGECGVGITSQRREGTIVINFKFNRNVKKCSLRHLKYQFNFEKI